MASDTVLREPIISVLGHVDHGKTSVLDYIRSSVVASREAGGITQHIGATDVPFETIKEVCGSLLDKLKLKTEVRGLLFVDTPGHEAFTTLRKRGGSVADLAILVVDLREGLMPQSIEAIQILKQYKTPFIVAANKIDLLSGWQKGVKIEEQHERVRNEFYDRFYKLMGQLSEQGFDDAELYHKVTDFKTQVAIVPVSAKTGEGIPELLMVLMGLTQQYLGDRLAVGLDSPGKGTVLEVKEERGLGTTIDVIIYDGRISRDDTIVVGAKGEPIKTRVKALLRPKPLDEMRDPRQKFQNANKVYAAAGVKIAAPGLEDALAGSPVYVGDSQELVDKVKQEIGEIEFEKEDLGLIIKADTLGSLEALVKILSENDVPIRKGSIGKVSKTDTIEAQAVSNEDPFLGVVMAFNSPLNEEARKYAVDNNVKVFESKIIYKLIEDYQDWIKAEKERQKQEVKAYPAKIQLLPDHVFRQSKPAIVGVEVLAGLIKTGSRLMREDGRVVGRVKTMQLNKEDIKEAKTGDKAAMSIDGVMIGRQLNEGDTAYTFLSDEDLKQINPEDLSEEEKQLVKEIREIKKKRTLK